MASARVPGKRLLAIPVFCGAMAGDVISHEGFSFAGIFLTCLAVFTLAVVVLCIADLRRHSG